VIDPTFTRTDVVIDEYGNRHQIVGELARGGQGVVYRTADSDLAIKQPIARDGQVDRSVDMKQRFERIRCLPLPLHISIALPLAVLRDESGYVMNLLSGMEPFSNFYVNASVREQIETAVIPSWISQVSDRAAQLQLLHYARSGSTRRRLMALSKCASVLSRLHSAGIVFGDVSPRNCFVSRNDSQEVSLIDPDNLRFERNNGGSAVYTPHYGAPEIVSGANASRPQTDSWSFSVMAFEVLALIHPFVGRAVLQADSDESGWDAKTIEVRESFARQQPYELAMSGKLPFVDDSVDRTNEAVGGLPRELILTGPLIRLFQESLGTGRNLSWRRAMLAYYALELARAHDFSVVCPSCQMSYFVQHQACVYCGQTRPLTVLASTARWQLVLQPSAEVVNLPQRLTQPFSLLSFDRSEVSVEIDLKKRLVAPARGSAPIPDKIKFRFLDGAT
jgi:serine/threonine protein kinase